MLKLGIFFMVALFSLVGCSYFYSSDTANISPDQDIATKETVDEGGVSGEGSETLEDESAIVFQIGGTNFSFDVTQIKVKKGDTVKIIFTSNDGFHDWVLDEFSAKTSQVSTGNTAAVTFVADKTGIFEYYCSVGKHREFGMVGKLIVED